MTTVAAPPISKNVHTQESLSQLKRPGLVAILEALHLKIPERSDKDDLITIILKKIAVPPATPTVKAPVVPAAAKAPVAPAAKTPATPAAAIVPPAVGSIKRQRNCR